MVDILLIILFTFAIIIGVNSDSSIFQPYTAEQNGGIIALIAVVVTVTTFIIERLIERYKLEQERKDTIHKSCTAILEELRDHRSAFDNSKASHLQ